METKLLKDQVLAQHDDIILRYQLLNCQHEDSSYQQKNYYVNDKKCQDLETAYAFFIELCIKKGSLSNKVKRYQVKHIFTPELHISKIKPARFKTGDVITIVYQDCSIPFKVSRITNDGECYLIAYKITIVINKKYLETIGDKTYRLWTHVEWDKDFLFDLDCVLARYKEALLQ